MQIVSYVFEVMRLLDMYRFYTYLLGIPDVSSITTHLLNTHTYLTLFRQISKRFPGPKSFVA